MTMDSDYKESDATYSVTEVAGDSELLPVTEVRLTGEPLHLSAIEKRREIVRLVLMRQFSEAEKSLRYQQDKLPLQNKGNVTFISGVGDVASTDAVPEPVSINWHRLEKSGFSKITRNRIDSLACGPHGSAGLNSSALSTTSLSKFLEFWQELAPAEEPNLTLLPNGRIKALWFKSPTNFFDVQFCQNGDVIYALYYRGKVHHGVGTAPEILALLKARAIKLVSKVRNG